MQVEFYQDASDEWRWRARADNNAIVGDSSEGYANLADCEGGFLLLAQSLRGPVRTVHIDKADGGTSVGNLQALIEQHEANNAKDKSVKKEAAVRK